MPEITIEEPELPERNKNGSRTAGAAAAAIEAQTSEKGDRDLEKGNKDGDASTTGNPDLVMSATATMDGNKSILSQDVKRRQEFSGLTLLWLAFQSIGTVYGDIGTSPLYVYSSTFTSPPDKDELLCAASLIIWTLAFGVTLKYVLVVLYADDAGEGGTFALYSLLARYARIEDREPGKAAKELARHPTGMMSGPNKRVRAFFERSRIFKLSVRLAAIFGVCAVLADGVFTPAQSVLGAIQGVRVQTPNLSTGAIIGITIAIIVVLFAAQPLGINRLANFYAPIICTWFLFNFASAIYNISKYDTSILKAFYPYYAFKWFWVKGSDEGFHRLGGILLCFTGVEALFADLGAFSRRAIQFSWLTFVFPILVFTYLGQAANISQNPEHFANPFFLTLPPGCFWPGLILSILAAIVASQAMITASFQILSQAMQLCYFPRIRTKFTSTIVHNQCYVPLANWLLMIGCVIMVGVFNNTTSLGNAYGLCVILVTMVTTCLTGLVAIIVWRFNPFFVVLPIFITFITWDGLWLSISVFKLPDGAWVTVLIACVLTFVMIVWRTGKSLQWSSEAEALMKIQDEIDPTSDHYKTMEGVGIFFDEMDDTVPPIFSYWLRSFQSRHEVLIFVHLRQTYHPTVSAEDRYTIKYVAGMPNTYRVLLRYGYNEPQSAITAASGLVDAVSAFLERERSLGHPESPRHTTASQQALVLAAANKAKEPVYMFGRKVFQNGYVTRKEKRITGALRGATVWGYVLIRDTMTSKPRLWELPPNRIVEIGKAVVL